VSCPRCGKVHQSICEAEDCEFIAHIDAIVHGMNWGGEDHIGEGRVWIALSLPGGVGWSFVFWPGEKGWDYKGLKYDLQGQGFETIHDAKREIEQHFKEQIDEQQKKPSAEETEDTV
jgi:hypothetical protein